MVLIFWPVQLQYNVGTLPLVLNWTNVKFGACLLACTVTIYCGYTAAGLKLDHHNRIGQNTAHKLKDIETFII